VLLLLEQILNGLQFGFMLFLLAAGLTLVFGIMHLLNLAHGSLYMIGAYTAATVTAATGYFSLGVLAALVATALAGMLLEAGVFRRLYQREHLDQVLATFAVIFTVNELTRILWGRAPLYLDIPAALAGSVEIIPGAPYPVYRLLIIAVGTLVALGLYGLINHTRLGMLIRAGASNREMVGALGANIKLLYTLVFGLGALLAGLAGALAGPILAIEVGMGENILILTFVVVVIGGIGSVRGALLGALLVGLTDTLGRAFLPGLFALVLPPAPATAAGSSLASITIYLLMVLILVFRPQGLFPVQGQHGA